MAEDRSTLTLAAFSPHVGSAFLIDLGEKGPVELTLVEVRDLGTAPRPASGPGSENRARAFALTFRGVGASMLPQRIYEFRHEVLGILSIFIVPIGPDEAGMRYEAIFN
jgi:hypothetical protein